MEFRINAMDYRGVGVVLIDYAEAASQCKAKLNRVFYSRAGSTPLSAISQLASYIVKGRNNVAVQHPKGW